MKKTHILVALIFVFSCILSVCGGVFDSVNSQELCVIQSEGSADVVANESGTSRSISSSDALQGYINCWGQNNAQYESTASDAIFIEDDINMSGYAVSGTIGTSTTAFTGTFDGSGHTISNLTITIDVSDASSSAYIGLFGNASGATIKNVTFSNLTIQFTGTASLSTVYAGLIAYASSCEVSCVSLSGTFTLKWADASVSYVGGLVGRADSCTIKNVQNASSESKVTLSSNFTAKTYLGLLVGRADNSVITQAIARRETSNIEFSSVLSTSTTYIGGGVGFVTNGSTSVTNVSFVDVEVDFHISTTSDFLGVVNVGGAVGIASGGHTTVKNLAISNTYDVSDDVIVGEVCGVVTSPILNSGNIAYIYYANQGYEKIASGSYSIESTDYVYAVSTSLRTLASTTDEDGNVSYTYFTSRIWAPLLGGWDFDTVFYVPASSLSLQCFYPSFTISVVSTSTLSASVDVSNASYGDSVKLTFLFAEGYENYYTPTILYLGSTNVGKLTVTGSGSSATYSISTPEVYDISAYSDGTRNGFQVTILSVNMSTMGEYSVYYPANSYSMHVVATAYSITENGVTLDAVVDNSVISVDTSVVPGYVYFSTSSTTTNKQITRSITITSTVSDIKTSVISGYAYAFSGYWLVVDNTGTSTLVKSDALSFSLEEYAGDGAESFEIYALYDDDACVINFDIAEGVLAVYVGGTLIGDDLTITVAKSLTEVKIEIHVSLDYELDKELFENLTDVFKGKISADSEETFDEEGYVSYVYTFDMTTLADESYSSTLNLKVHTNKIATSSNLIWWILGGVGGGLVVVGLIALVVFLIIKRRNNGGFGGSSFSKSRKKGVYY